MQGECRTKKQKVPNDVAEAVVLAQKLVTLSNALAVVPLPSKVRSTTEGNAAESVTETEKSKARISKLESTETITDCRHEELMYKSKRRYTEEKSVCI